LILENMGMIPSMYGYRQPHMNGRDAIGVQALSKRHARAFDYFPSKREHGERRRLG
jgi:hypothetical protein